MSTREGFQIRGAGGQTVVIPDSRYYFNTKSRCERMQQNSLSVKARRVYACLELGTMGFQQELGVVMTPAGQRSMTPDDVCVRSGMDRQDVRQGLEELEDEGLAERRADDGGALRRGHVEIYSWAEPRAKKEVCRRARLQIPKWFSDEDDPETALLQPLRPLINRFKLQLTDDIVVARAYKAELEEAARAYKEAEKVALRALERVCAGPRINKDERTERTGERTVVPSSSEILKKAGAAAAALRPPWEPAEPKTPPPLVPDSHPQNTAPESDEFEPVRDHLHSLDSTATDKQVHELIATCRAVRGDIRPGLLLQVLMHLTAGKDHLRQPFGFLAKHAPDFLRSRKAFEIWLKNGSPSAPETAREKQKREIQRLLLKARTAGG